MKDNHADVYATIPSLQFPQVLDLTTSKDVSFLPVDKEVVDSVAEKYKLSHRDASRRDLQGQHDDYYS
jgi:TRAP-type uncharacterized transport system substrate-binding protein